MSQDRIHFGVRRDRIGLPCSADQEFPPGILQIGPLGSCTPEQLPVVHPSPLRVPEPNYPAMARYLAPQRPSPSPTRGSAESERKRSNEGSGCGARPFGLALCAVPTWEQWLRAECGRVASGRLA